MTDTETTRRAGFTGWLREGRGRWRAVAEGGSYGECLAELLKVASTGPTDRVVLASGRDPNDDGRQPR